MDQLKTQLAMVKQHSFWALCLGILGVSIGSWWVSTSKLATERAAQEGKIKGGFSAVKDVMGIPLHANGSVIQGMEAMNRKYAKEVLDGWQLQYDQQAGVLVWPAGFEKTGFLAFVDKLRPIEKIPVVDGKVAARDDLPRDFKEEYRNFIEEELPKLAETIKAKWVASSLTSTPGGGEGGFGGGAPGGFGPGGGGGFAPGGGLDANGVPVFDDSVVIWNPANQDEILKTHFGFTMRSTLPSVLEVLYAQEDYWVLDNIMQIIRETNKVDGETDATARHDAVIKSIDFVRIGRSAYGQAGMVTPIGRSATAGGEGGAMAGTEGGAAPPPAGGEGGAAMPPGGGEGGMGGMDQLMARDPAINRYVDDKYQPLPPDRLRGALKSMAPEDALLAVAKRIPVRLRLEVDQRKLNVLLAKCGNSKLPFEVRQVRINRPPATPGAGGGGMGGGYGGGEGGMPGGGGFAGGGGGFGGGFGGGMGGMPGGGGLGGGMPGGGEGGFGGGMGMGAGKPGMVAGNVASDATVDPNLIPIELFGIVYIYNPANKEQLNTGPPPDGSTPPADPNAVPADPGATPPPADGTQPPVEAAAGLNGTTPAENQTQAPTPGAQ